MADPLSTISNFISSAMGGSSASTVKFPVSLLETGSNKYMTFQPYQVQKLGRSTPPKKNHLNSTIALPIPANLTDNYSWAYQDVALGRFLGGVLNSVQRQMAAGKDGLAALRGAISDKSMYSNLGTAAISNLVGSISQAAGASPGVDAVFIGAANPYLRNAFAGVGFRQWQFQLFMAARNPDDAGNILEIINTFRYYGSPYGAGTAVLDNNYLWKIKFITQPVGINLGLAGTGTKLSGYDNSAPYLPVVQDCSLVGMSVTYNSMGLPAFHQDGAPVDVLLTLVFKEASILTQETIDGWKNNGKGVSKKQGVIGSVTVGNQGG